MNYLKNKIEKISTGWWLIILGTLNLLLFCWLFGFHVNNDTDGFLTSIDYFKGLSDTIMPNRFLNPFYAVVGSTILRPFGSAAALIITNIVFYYGLIILNYDLIRRVFANKWIAFWSTLLLVTSYSMIRYALTQVEDIGGYFWFLATIYVGWRWWQSKKDAWLYLAGAAIAFGVLTKESGCMGAFFVGILFLFDWQSIKIFLSRLIKVSVLPILVIIVNYWRGQWVGYNSSQWFIDNWKIFSAENYTFFRWLGVNLTTYNLLWILIIVGLVYLICRWPVIERNLRIYFIAILLPSLSYFAWPLFISRTVFISAWLFIPLACYGAWILYDSLGFKRTILGFLVVALFVPYLLQILLGYNHLFPIIEGCKFNLTCSWQRFHQEWKQNWNYHAG